MNKTRPASIFLLCLAVFFLGSCATFEGLFLGMKSDPDLIEKGTAAWNEGGPEKAAKFWSRVKAGATREQYLAYIEGYNAGIKALESASALKAADESLLPAYAALKQRKFPQSLNVGKFRAGVMTLRERAEEAAEVRIRALITDNQLALAKDAASAALAVIDDSDRLAGLLKEIDAKYSFRNETEAKARQAEKDSDAELEAARVAPDQDKKIAAYKVAAAGYANAIGLLDDLSTKVPAFAGSFDADRKRLKKKGQDCDIEMNRRIKDYAYALKEKQGEDFASVPEQKDLGGLTDEQIVAYNAKTRKKIQVELATVKSLAADSPGVVPPEDVRAMEDNVKRMDRVQVEVKKPVEKGKTVMPAMIGLFNPQKKDRDKSRPGVFRSSTTAKIDQWWGMVEIPKDIKNDLVVENVVDIHDCRVAAKNQTKGQDLVSSQYKGGNSYPVLNAGSRLQDGLYFLELSKGTTGTYKGEVVIYKAWMNRTKN